MRRCNIEVINVPIKEHFIDNISKILVERHGMDMRNVAAVFPGRRPSLFLIKSLSEILQCTYFPPSIFSIDDFIFYLYSLENRGRRLLRDGPEIEYYLFRAVKEGISPGRFGKDLLRICETMDAFTPWAGKILSAINEVMVELAEPKDIEKLAEYEEEIIDWVKDFWRNISGIMEAFHRLLDEKGVFYRGMAYRWVYENIEKIDIPFKDIYLCGFSALTKTEEGIFRHLLSNGASLILHSDRSKWEERPSSPFYFHYLLQKKWGFEPVEYGTNGKKETKLKFYNAPDLHTEVAMVGKIIGKADGVDTCIVLPNPEALIPLLYSSGINAENGFNITMGYPFDRTPFFSLFDVLKRVHLSMEGERLYIPDYLRLLSHPYIKSLVINGTPVREDLLHLSKKLKGLFMNTGEVFIHIGELPSLFVEGIQRELIEELNELLIKGFLNVLNVGEWTMRFSKIIDIIGDSIAGERNPITNTYLYTIKNLLDEIAGSEANRITFSESSGLWNYIGEILSNTRVPFIGEPLSGVQIMGMLETRSLNFKKVIILDVNDGIIPESYKYDPLLPSSLRQILGLPGYRDMEAIYSYNFFKLIEGAEEVHLFYRSGTGEEGEKRLKSRFIERLEWEMEKMGDRPEIQNLSFPGILRNESIEIKKRGQMMERLLSRALSYTALQDYIDCPIRFYLKHIAEIEEEETISEDIEARDVGIFLHQFLNRTYQPYIGRTIDFKIDDVMKEFSREFEKHFKNVPKGKRMLLKRVMEIRLYQFLKIDRDSFTNNVVYGLEKEYKGEFEFSGSKILFKGFIDRIDRMGDGYILIDYKTGKIITPNKKILPMDIRDMDGVRKKIKTLQPVIYIKLFTGSEKIPVENVKFYLYSFKEGKLKPVDTPLDAMEEGLRITIEELLSPDIPFYPVEDSSTCKYCKFKTFCRKSL